MNALALAVALAMGPTDPGEDRLPLNLAEATAEPARAKANPEWWVGGHIGLASAYDSDDVSLDVGFNGRVQLMPWLAVDASLDFQTRQNFEHDQIHVVQIPFEFGALFYPLQDGGPLRPYGQAGVGFSISDTSYTGSLGRSDSTDFNLLFFLGLGAEFLLNENVAFDASLRFVFVQDPPHFAGNSADFLQFTVGVLFKLAK
jgi:opacity protein-like surface antigen